MNSGIFPVATESLLVTVLCMEWLGGLSTVVTEYLRHPNEAPLTDTDKLNMLRCLQTLHEKWYQTIAKTSRQKSTSSLWCNSYILPNTITVIIFLSITAFVSSGHLLSSTKPNRVLMHYNSDTQILQTWRTRACIHFLAQATSTWSHSQYGETKCVLYIILADKSVHSVFANILNLLQICLVSLLTAETI